MTISNFMKMVERSPNGVENTEGKREIARYEQFLLFPQCFQKTCTTDKKKSGLVWERVKGYVLCLFMIPVNSYLINQNHLTPKKPRISQLGMHLKKAGKKTKKMRVTSILSFFCKIFIIRKNRSFGIVNTCSKKSRD